MFRIFLALILFFLPAQAFALAVDWKEDDAVAVRLISGVTAVGNDAVIPLGLEMKLKEGWHTYWRSPGQAGLPPQLDWSQSQTDAGNLQSAALLYPAPRRYTLYGLETIGYRNHVVFPIDATLRQAGKALDADVSIDFLVCSSTCVPKHFDLALAVPAGASVASAEAALLRQARDQLPTDSEESGLLLKGVTGDGESLIFAVSSRDPIAAPDIFIEDDQNIGFSAPEVNIDPTGLRQRSKSGQSTRFPKAKRWPSFL